MKYHMCRYHIHCVISDGVDETWSEPLRQFFPKHSSNTLQDKRKAFELVLRFETSELRETNNPIKFNLCRSLIAIWQNKVELCSEVLTVPLFPVCASDAWSVYAALVAIYPLFVELWSVPCGLEGLAVSLDGWGVMDCEVCGKIIRFEATNTCNKTWTHLHVTEWLQH